MEPEPVGTDLPKEISGLLAKLEPTPSAEWVATETDRLLRQFEAAFAPDFDNSRG